MKRISDDETTSFSLRDISDLYASHTTYHCASNGCVPCAYKIGCFDVALDKEFCQAAPNQRPEQCPRSSREKGDLGTLGYQKGLNILTVGDGDFSFSLGVARIMSGTGLTATSYESKETLIQVYPQIEVTMAELESLGAKLHFQVDATRIRETLDTARPGLYDRIVWNFPCQAVAKGRDGQNEEMENNKKLVADFVSNTKGLLVRKGGQIHINHKTKVRSQFKQPIVLLLRKLLIFDSSASVQPMEDRKCGYSIVHRRSSTALFRANLF
jgi:25S rRNA (uracil2634-N3)-methyltransferase